MPSTGPSPPSVVSGHRRGPRGRGPRGGHQRRARGGEPPRLPPPGPRRGRRRGRGHLRLRGGPPHPPGRAPGRAGLSTAASWSIDIGGGSTEIVLGERDEAIVARSLKLGAIRLTHRFFPDDTVKARAVTRARRHIRASLAPMRREHRPLRRGRGQLGHGPERGRDGPGRPRRASPVQSLNQVVITRPSCRAGGRGRCWPPPPSPSGGKLPGLDAGRADIILAGALVARARCSTPSGDRADDLGLRPARRRPARHLPADPRRLAAPPAATSAGAASLHLAELIDDDPEHSERSAHLALQLFDQLATVARPRRRGPGAARGGRAALQRRPVRLPRRPPQAQLLRDPELRAPDRVHRSTRSSSSPWSPATTARARPSPSTRPSPRSTRPISRWCGPSPGSCGWPSASTGPTAGSVGALRCCRRG